MGRLFRPFCSMETYVRLILWTYPSGQYQWLKCLRATADFYGWLDAYEEDPEDQGLWGPNGRPYISYPKKVAAWKGGLPLRICRTNNRCGNPRGMTNQFRVSRGTSNAMLADLARVTRVRFGWMEDMRGKRRSYRRWMAMTDAPVPGYGTMRTALPPLPLAEAVPR